VIRITFLIPTLDRSGAEKQLTLLAAGLPSRGFDVEVLALDRGGPYAEVLEAAGIPVTVLGKRGKLDPRVLWRLRRRLKSRRPEILHTWLFSANVYGRLVCDVRTTKVVVSERCVDSWKAGWQLWLDRRLIGRTDRLVANSASVAAFYVEQGFPADRVRVIPNGVPAADAEAIDRGALLEALSLPTDARLVCHVGRLAKQKRVDDLLWAAQILRQAEPRAYFLVVGDGPERERLERHARDVECSRHVRFVGHRADAAQILAACDVFWLGSGFEGLSNSILEAMSYSVPVVATDIPPNRELIRHGVEGYLVEIGDGAGFAQYTLRLLNDPELARLVGAAGKARVEAEFSVQEMINRHERLYRELLGWELP
jgi:glycosyltransferase involved in cell wall biosynthesis